MLSQEVQEALAERLVQRIEETNTLILKKIGEGIKYVGTLTPTQAYQLGQILKYGGSYNEIVKALQKMTNLNVEDIYKILEEVAKHDKQFARKFYKYRGIDYIPYEKDIALQRQVDSIARLTAENYLNIANTKAIGYIFEDLRGNKIFRNIEQTYRETIDRAIISITQGKTTFQEEMRKTIKDLGGSGLVYYKNGVTRRLDSAVRMNMLDGIAQVTMENSISFGREYGADGVEISVHTAPAPDHEDIQGRQFSIKIKDGETFSEYDKMQNGQDAEDASGHIIKGAERRHIGELNCRHYTFNIIIGVSKPLYSDEELQKIKKENQKGFEFEGNHYTNYAGTQLQRRMETYVRKAKDKQILAKASGPEFKKDVEETEKKIRQMTNRYNELCKTSGLPSRKERMAVSGYRRIKV